MLYSTARRPDFLVRITASLSLAILLGYLAAQVVFRADLVTRALTGNLLLMAANLGATVLLVIAARAASRSAARAGLAWGLLAAAQACSFTSAVLRSTVSSAGAGQPVPALAIICYVAFYPLFIAGLLHLSALAMSPTERLKLLIDVGLLSLGAGMILWSLWLGPAVAMGASAAGRLVQAASGPPGDLALLFLLAVLLLRQFEDRSRPLLLLAVGTSFLLLTDLSASYQFLMGHYTSGGWMDAGWLVGFGLLAIAGAYQALARPGSGGPAMPVVRLVGRQLASLTQLALSYLPYAVLVIALALLFWERNNLWQLDPSLLGWSVGTAAVLVIIRQLIASQETGRLLSAERRWRESDGILLELSRRLLGAVDDSSIGAQAVEIAALALRANQAMVAMPDLDGQLTLGAAWGWPSDLIGRLTFEAGNLSQIGYTVQQGQATVVDGVTPPGDFQLGHALREQPNASSLSVPIVIAGRAVGALLVTSRLPQSFDEGAVGLLALIANQTAAAFEKLRLFDVTRRQVDELTLLHAIATAGAESADEDAFLERITSIVGDTLFPAHFGVMLLEADSGLLRSHRSYRGDNEFATALGHGITGHVALTAQPARVADVSLDPRYLAVEQGIRSELCVPLVAGDQVMGVINAESGRLAAFSAADERLLGTIARQVATALAKLRLFERLIQAEQQRAGEVEAVRQASLGLTASLDLQTVLKAILQSTLRMVASARQAFVFLYRAEGGGRLTFGAARARDGSGQEYWEPRPHGLSYTVARQGEVVIVPDVRADPLFRDSAGDWGGAIVGLPLKIGARVVGVMNVIYPQPRTLPESELRVLRHLGDQAAIAIENARLFEAERAAREQAEALREVAATLSSSLDRERLLQLTLEQLARVVGYDSAAIMLFSEQRLVMAAHHGFRDPLQAGAVLSAAEFSHVAEVVEHSRPVILADTLLDPRWRRLPGSEYIRCWLGVPLAAQGRVIGLLSLDKAVPNFYTEHDAELATAFANQAAVAIDNARLFEAERRQLALAQTLQAVGSLLTAQMSLQEVFTRIFDLLAQVVTYDSVSVQLLAGDGGMDLAAGRGFPDLEIARENVRKVSEHRPPQQWLDQKLIVISDTANDPRWLRTSGTDIVRSWIGAALLVKGELVGLLTTESATPGAYDAMTGETVRAFANQAAVAIENGRLFEESQRQTRTLSSLYDTALATGSVLDTDVLLNRLYEQVRPLLNPDAFSVAYYHADTEELETSLAVEDGWAPTENFGNGRRPVSHGLTGWVVRNRRSLLVSDLLAEPIPVPPRQGIRPARSWLGVPLIARDRIIGAAAVQSAKPRAFNLADQRFLESVASQVAIAIENARLFEETRQHAAEVTTASEILHLLNASTDIADSFPQISVAIKAITGCERVSLAMLDHSHAKVTMFALDQPRAELPQGREFPITATAAAADVLAGHIHLTPDLDSERDYAAERALYAAGFRSRLNLPLHVGVQVIGALNLVWLEPIGYLRANLPLLSQLADALALAIEKARLLAEARRRDAILEALANVSSMLLMPGAADEVMSDALAQLGRAAGVSRAYIFQNQTDGDSTLFANLLYEWTAPGEPSRGADVDLKRLPYQAAGMARWIEILGAGRTLDGAVRDFPPSERGRLERQGVLSLAVVPIISAGEWWGWVGFDDRASARIWSAAEIEALKSAAGALGAFLARQRAETAEREQRALAEALRDTAAVLNSTLDLDEVLDHILADVGHVVPHGSANIMLIENGEAKVVRNRDLLGHFPPGDMLHVHYTVAEVANLRYMLETGLPAIIVDVDNDPGWVSRPQTRFIRSLVGAPILIKGRVIGFITLDNDQPGFYHPAHAERLQAFAHQAGLAIENARLYASIRQHAEDLEQRVVERTQELADANRRLRELDLLKDQFISNVSHELRTPLTNIKLHLGLLEKRGPEVLPRYLPTLQRETERLRKLIEDLLDLSRLQTDTGPLRRDRHPLDELLGEVLTLHAARADAKNLSLRLEPNPAGVRVPVDRAQIMQVFTNLVGNAVAYTPSGGHALVASELASMGNAAGVSIHFSNDGPLIPPEDFPHLFRRFYRGRNAHDSGEPGTGLGLAICREIVERHGGQIEATSQPGQGTRFSVWLPLN